MYLDRLIIRTGSEVIRDIPFKRGLNLIIDETSTSSTDSGNNVGKTTFLRVIDYCLGGKKEDIYTDKEFKRKNEGLYKFLINKAVTFELIVQSKKGTKHSIIRSLENKPIVDGVEISSEPKFADAIMTLLFGFSGGRPTLGQLLNKFIRVEEYQITNALYFLHPMADYSDYEAVFLFLFGFRDHESLGKKRKLVDKIKKLKKQIDDSPYRLEDLEQQLHLIDKDIEEMEGLKKTFNFNNEVDSELVNLKSLQIVVTELKAKVASLTLKLEVNKESLRQLKDAKSNLNVDAVAKMYSQAKLELPNLKKKFEEVITFHNQMIENKTKYIQKCLSGIEKNLSENKAALQSKLEDESKILKQMSNKGALGEYDKISSKLQDKSREKGNKEGLIEILQSVNIDLSKATKDLSEVNQQVELFEKQLKENLKKFNDYFSSFSNKLYGDKYYLTTMRENNKTTDNYLLDIGNMNENIGTGKKKAQISALDLAYLKYSDESSMHVPLFILHDQLETVFENQIETLFEVANSLTGQFVVAVLSDKLHKIEKEKIDANCILKLSQDNKLFKIP